MSLEKDMSEHFTVLPDACLGKVNALVGEYAFSETIGRLWSKDPSLWSNDPSVQKKIANRLGWLGIASVMEGKAEEIINFVDEVRACGFTHAVLLGMGGSSLFSEVCAFTFGPSKGYLDLKILDSTDPSTIDSVRKLLPLDKTIFIISSKSGATIESSSLGDYFYEELKRIKKEKAGENFIAITDSDTLLEAQARGRSFRRVFVHSPSEGGDVGGRFSALTYFGLVPAALLGVDIKKLLSRAKQMLACCGPSVSAFNNPACKLAAFLARCLEEERDKLYVLASSRLSSFGGWLEQLIAESTGKDGKGIIPIYGENARKANNYGSDRMFIELQLENEPDKDLDKYVKELAAASHPVFRIKLNDSYDIGAQAIYWSLATALVSVFMKINPFDEPNVQESKDRTKELLNHYCNNGSLPSDEPQIIQNEASLICSRDNLGGKNLPQAVTSFLSQAQGRDYIAISSFLPRSAELDGVVFSLREAIAQRFSVATMLGFGPRYLHSTGQLHKGGPDRLLVLFLTSDDPLDLPVPGKKYTFGILKTAQAIGDFQALCERNRRVLRLHLGKSPLNFLKQIPLILKR